MSNITALAALGLAGLVSVLVAAENQPLPLQPQQPVSGSGGTTGIKTFDDRVFNLNGDPGSVPTNKVSPRGNSLYPGDEPDYNQEQRSRWLSACEHLKENPGAYRDCFSAEKKADLAKQSRDMGKGRGASPGRDKNSIEKPKDPYDSISGSSNGSQDNH